MDKHESQSHTKWECKLKPSSAGECLLRGPSSIRRIAATPGSHLIIKITRNQQSQPQPATHFALPSNSIVLPLSVR